MYMYACMFTCIPIYTDTYDVYIFTLYMYIYTRILVCVLYICIYLYIDRSIFHSARRLHTGPTTRPRPRRVFGKHRWHPRPPPSSIPCGDIPLLGSSSSSIEQHLAESMPTHLTPFLFGLSVCLSICACIYLSLCRPT